MAVGWLRRAAARPRQAPSSADPVTTALAEAATAGPLVPRFDDLEPVLDELPTWFSVTDDTTLDGFDTLVSFDDEIHTYCDPAEDGLEQALADQPGISEVYAEDREVVYLATRLHLDDVAAAVVRAVVEVNRTPRPVTTRIRPGATRSCTSSTAGARTNTDGACRAAPT